MITIEDCYGFCDLDQDTIEAIATHEHLNEIVAIEFAQALLKQDGGASRLHDMIEDDIQRAKIWGKNDQVVKYQHTLTMFDNKFLGPPLAAAKIIKPGNK